VTKQADLNTFLFEGQPHPLAADLLQWMEASSRFTLFVDTYRDKIRKKVRVTRQPESGLDLRCELEVAYGLLNDRRMSVAYEAYASAKKRGPDFTVSYRVNLVFNIEVARMRMDGEATANPGRMDERLLRILLNKIGQMQPGTPNVLVIHTREELWRILDLERFMQAIKVRVEKKDPTFYSFTPYVSPADFYKDFSRLNGILLWVDSAQLWVNKQARLGLPEKVLRRVSALPSNLNQPQPGQEK
jgi:hypothetical protein